MQSATYEWLEQNHFPPPGNVLFCNDSRAKLQRIAYQLTESPKTIVLIDDLYEKLVVHFSTLERQEQHILSQYFLLGAYGAREWSADAPFRIIPLPSWNDIDHFIANL